jgi:hypothetical protein
MSESARAFCRRCLRAFYDLTEGEAPSAFHRSIKELVEKSPKCRACFASYRKTAALCRQAMRKTPGAVRREALREFLRLRLRDRA